MNWDWLRSSKWFVGLLAGLLLFQLGLLVLHHNPFWRNEPGQPGMLDHRVYALNAVGHLTAGAGLLCLFASVLVGISRVSSRKRLYWVVVVAGIGVWCALFGIKGDYDVRWGWGARTGITELTVYSSQKPQNRLWQKVVLWQVEPDLANWLRTGAQFRRTHGWISVKIVRIVPIAFPTLDCDCRDCCKEDDKPNSGR